MDVILPNQIKVAFFLSLILRTILLVNFLKFFLKLDMRIQL